MEEKKKESESYLYKSRSFTRCITDSLKFVGSNFKQLFTCSIYGLLPVSLIIATADLMVAMNNVTTAFSAIWSMLFLVLILLGAVYTFSLYMAMLAKYVELGYLPHMGIKGWLPLMRIRMRRSLISILLEWVTTFLAIVIPVCYFMLLYASTGKLAALGVPAIHIPSGTMYFLGALFWMVILVTLIIPLQLFQAPYVLEERSFGKSIRASYSFGIPHFGSVFVMAVVVYIIAGITSSVGLWPYTVVEFVKSVAERTILQGDTAELPSYYWAIRFVFYTIGLLITFFAQLITMIPMVFLYASLVAKRQDREKQLKDAAFR